MNWVRISEIVTAILLAEIILTVAGKVAQRYQEQPQTANAPGHTSQGIHGGYFADIARTAVDL